MIFGSAAPAVNYKLTPTFFSYMCDAKSTPAPLALYYSFSDTMVLAAKPSTLAVSKFRISPNLVYTIPMWFYKISDFLNEARLQNYCVTETQFPQPVFEDPELTNFFVYVLFILNNLNYIDVTPVQTVAQSFVRVLLKTGLACMPPKHRNLVLDLCFQFIFRPSTNDNLTALNVLLDVLRSEVQSVRSTHYLIIAMQ